MSDLLEQGKQFHRTGQLAQAEGCYRKVLGAQPDHLQAVQLMRALMYQTGRVGEAIEAMTRAVAKNPNLGDVENDLAMALEDVGRLDEALPHFARATELCPARAEYFSNYAVALQNVGRIDEAIALFRRAIELNPGFSPLYSNLLSALHYDATDPRALFDEHRRWARLAEQFPAPASYPNDRDADRRLRVGYVSPDFREHSVSYFAQSFLGAHDHGAFEIFCYDNSRRPDSVTERFRAMADHWRRATDWMDDRLAQQVQADRIDILVDLDGHMAGNRMLLFARKPAPVQVTYLGYPDTTGLSRVEYRITDAIADPPRLTDAYNSEKLLRLPGSAWCYLPATGSLAVSPLPMLTGGAPMFASFNNFAKVTRRTIALWASVLLAVPESRLLIKAAGLDHASARQRVATLFKEHGVHADRVELMGKTRTTAEHLAVYQRCDVALDTFPYGGTTTTCEALWMGLPVITLLGEMHMSRVGASLLTSIGMQELIARDADEYSRIAAQLVGDSPRLANLRAGLRDRLRGSRLMDAKQFTRDLEIAYRQMWRGWAATTSPRV